MKHLGQTVRLIFLYCAAISLVACRAESLDEGEIDTMVAHTQTAAVQQTITVLAHEPTETPESVSTGDLLPLHRESCEQLTAFMVNRLPIPPVEQKLVAVEHQGETGEGCQAIAVGTGEVFPDMMVVEEAMQGILWELGWKQDPSAPSCLGAGGWGPGASSHCYVRADALCEVFVHVDPTDKALCGDDEPISLCFDRLTPEQILYTVELTCARDLSPSEIPLESALNRIEFEAGATEAIVEGVVASGGFDHYVLSAMAGQEMTVTLFNPQGEMTAYDTAVLAIWGEDGTVLISDHADALNWVGELPLTQDYFIDVKSVSDQPVPYILMIKIPPL